LFWSSQPSEISRAHLCPSFLRRTVQLCVSARHTGPSLDRAETAEEVTIFLLHLQVSSSRVEGYFSSSKLTHPPLSFPPPDHPRVDLHLSSPSLPSHFRSAAGTSSYHPADIKVSYLRPSPQLSHHAPPLTTSIRARWRSISLPSQTGWRATSCTELRCVY